MNRSLHHRNGSWLALAALLFVIAPAFPATEVQVTAPAGRPVLVVDGKPLPMSGYSPIYWEKPWIEKHLENFKAQPLGYVFAGPPSMRGTAFFWTDAGALTAEPSFKGLDSSKFATFDEGATYSLSTEPGTRLLIRFGLDETDAWKKAHPDELVLTETGERLNVPSLASETFWGNSANAAGALVRWYEKQPYANKIIGYADFWRCEGTHESTIMGCGTTTCITVGARIGRCSRPPSMKADLISPMQEHILRWEGFSDLR
jgi:hypothetical protein